MTMLGNAGCRRHVAWMVLLVCALWPAVIEAAPRRSAMDGLDRKVSSQVTLRKCVTADGGIAYQSDPCASGARELWSREEALDASQAPPAKVADTPRAQRAGSVASKRGGPGTSTSTSSRQRCEAARREAAQKRDRLWNRLKFDDLSRLDAWVADRCR